MLNFKKNILAKLLKYFVDSGVTENEQNCFRFFRLQYVSREAMRTILDGIPGIFKKKWEKFEECCKRWNGKFLNC